MRGFVTLLATAAVMAIAVPVVSDAARADVPMWIKRAIMSPKPKPQPTAPKKAAPKQKKTQ